MKKSPFCRSYSSLKYLQSSYIKYYPHTLPYKSTIGERDEVRLHGDDSGNGGNHQDYVADRIHKALKLNDENRGEDEVVIV